MATHSSLGPLDTLDLSSMSDQAPVSPQPGLLLVADVPTVQIPTDTRSEAKKKFGQRRIQRLASASGSVASDDDVIARRQAAQEALRKMVPEQRRLLLQHASRSNPLFMAIAMGWWEEAAKLVNQQPVTASELETRNRLHVWLTVQTPIALECEPTLAA